MPDLRVDASVLRQMETSLARIADDLGAAEQQRQDLEQAWGSRVVASAMTDFFCNWDRHRRQLQHSLQALSEMAGSAQRSFDQVEQELTDALRAARRQP